MHYLALTFSTLLSSQVSGAHRAEFLVLGLGQRPTVRGLRRSSQTASSWPELLVSPSSVSNLRIQMSCKHISSEDLVGQWVPSGSAAIRSTDLLASRTPLRPQLLYACNTSRSNCLTLLPRETPTRGRSQAVTRLSAVQRRSRSAYSRPDEEMSSRFRRSVVRDRYGADRTLASPNDGESPV